MNRREFLQGATVAGMAAGMEPVAERTPPAGPALGALPRPGPKPAARGRRAVASSSHWVVTETMLAVMRAGGNAVDAGIAGCLVQPVVQPEMTNHTGTVTFLYWEAKSGKAYQLESSGTLVPGMAPFRPLPAVGGLSTGPTPPCACVPGFMPGMKALHERFGSRKWSELCEPAVRWATEGVPVHTFQYGVLSDELPSNTYFPSGRDFFLPGGFTPAVGEVFRSAALAETMRRLQSEGPDDFISGQWARAFVAEGNRLGWQVKLEHLKEIPPRWIEPLRWRHRGYEVLQLAPPERVGVFSALVLGILGALDVASSGPASRSADTLYAMGSALRWAEFELGYLQDPEVFGCPVDLWLSAEHHRRIADVLRGTRPKTDMTEHVRALAGVPALAAAGLPTAAARQTAPVTGSCELSIVDPEGNWVQMMNTLQSGGIPGVVVEGVPMVGSHAVTDLSASIAGWFWGGGRLRLPIGNTIVLKNGKPWLSLGTPGNVHATIPQVLSNVLDHGMSPEEAIDAPRMLPLRDDYVLEVESRLPEAVVAGTAKLGVRVAPLPPYDWHMGSFQMSWRDEKTGEIVSFADPRRAGKAGAF
ncbi:MAG TPA: gamma-glutamyltransferase [Thermoanaerobaculia bacterium]|nr:gamma-glutamyltransferase [Thermoanaerobaculia bacterium]